MTGPLPSDNAVSPVLPEAAQLSALLDGWPVIIGVKDLDGRYTYVNRPFAELMSGQPDSFIGKTDLDLFPEPFARRLRANDRQVFEQAREQSFHERLTIGGRERIFLTRKFLQRDAAGSVSGICLMATDVTREFRVEKALRSIAVSVSAATGPEVFHLIVQAIAEALEVDLAFIARIVPEEPDRLQALSAWYRGQHQPPPCYHAAGTPCADVMANGFTYISGNLKTTHPGDDMVFQFDLNSYAGFPLADAEGRVIGVLSVCHRGPLPDAGIIEDLLHIFSVRACAELERARTEEALRHSEASYRAIFEHAEDAIFIHDLETGAIVDVNRKACETYGYTRQEFLSLDVAELGSGVPPYTGDDAAAHIRLAIDGKPQRFEWHRRNKDGSLHWDEVTLNRVRLSGVDRILAFTREITERKVREATVLASRSRLRAMVGSALDAIITMDTAGRIVGFNPAAEACFGWTEQEAKGRNLADLLIPEHLQQAHVRGLEHYLRSGKSRLLGRRVEMSALRRDGSEFPVELAIAESEGQDSDGRGRLFIGYLRDISERHAAEAERQRLEAQLRQAQKMEAIGHLAGGIAHDFNNILTGVSGYLHLGRERAAQLGDPELLRFLDQAGQSAYRASELIRQLLTFSRGRGGNPEPVDLGELVRRGANLLHSTLPSSVEMEFELDDGLPPVYLDPVQAEQILLNLCINARDAMSGRGHIRIRARPMPAGTRRCASCQQAIPPGMVELSVCDDGPGIPAAGMERIFEPFFTTKPAGQGSGMGLAIVHGIVHEAGGHIELDTVEGSGTRFGILLPQCTGASHAPAAGNPASNDDHSDSLTGTVMVVDDEESVGAYMLDQLRSWGLEAVHLAGPEAALAWLDQQHEPTIDLLVADYTMPGMNGTELIAAARERCPGLPSILYSGYTDEIPKQRLAELGLAPPLGKPVDPERLFAAIRSLLPESSRRHRSD